MAEWKAFRAVLFDLDGVLTPTVDAHRHAWARLFSDVFTGDWADVAPYTDDDYAKLVDGRPRYDGVRAVLASRGIVLPEGSPDDDPSAETVCGLGNRKNAVFAQELAKGLAPYPGSMRFLDAVQAAGLAVAVVSGSRNARAVLQAAGLQDRFTVVVDGLVAAARSLPGKPLPDTFLEAARQLGVAPAQAVVIEDAIGGVAAGRAGGFGLVVGVNRGSGKEALLSGGADQVVDDLSDMLDKPVIDDPLDRGAYPVDPWRLIDVTQASNKASDTIFSVGNGFIGIAGSRDESGPANSYVNGFYETWRLRYPETAYGLAREGQAIQPLPSPFCLHLLADGHPFGDGEPVNQRRELDMSSGLLTRQTVWQTASGQVQVSAQRLASFTRRGLVASQLEVTPLEQAMELEIRHDLKVQRFEPIGKQSHDPRSGSVLDCRATTGTAWCGDDGQMGMRVCALRSGIEMTALLDSRVEVDGRDAHGDSLVAEDGGEASTIWRVKLAAGQTARLTILAWHELDDIEAQRCQTALEEAVALGWDGVVTEQRQWLDDYWTLADIRIPDQALQQAIRWNLFQALQGSVKADGAGIGAKGVTGVGYDGHYFWDMETYVLPLLTYTAPEAARAALGFRLATLPQAVERAQELHLAGALYPWRTINGREASAYYEAGTAQFHINADIAHALCQYVDVTGDESIMTDGGLDVLVETARMWASRGFWGDDGAFHFHYVTGPDEYSALVDDNVYTNLMARANLRAAADAVERWGGGTPDPGEIAGWRRIADGICVPYDKARGVHPQDAHFLTRETWDLESIPAQNFPLLLHYHPLTIYRHQVLKQADVVLAQILCPEDFTPAQKRANFDFYDPLTTGDSTLSAVPQAIEAVEVGHLELAEKYLAKAAFIDLADSHHNTDAGVHLAVASGIWSILVFGFGGLRDTDGQLSLWPRLSPGVPSLEFGFLWHGSALHVAVDDDGANLSVTGQRSVSLTIWGRTVVVAPGATVTVRQ